MGHLGIDQNRLKRFLQRVGQQYQLARVYIFGSRVRGDELLESDYDLILVSEDFEGIPFRNRIGKMLSLWEGEVDLEVLCYTPEEFEKKRGQICIVQEALKEGIEISSES